MVRQVVDHNHQILHRHQELLVALVVLNRELKKEEAMISMKNLKNQVILKKLIKNMLNYISMSVDLIQQSQDLEEVVCSIKDLIIYME